MTGVLPTHTLVPTARGRGTPGAAPSHSTSWASLTVVEHLLPTQQQASGTGHPHSPSPAHVPAHDQLGRSAHNTPQSPASPARAAAKGQGQLLWSVAEQSCEPRAITVSGLPGDLDTHFISNTGSPVTAVNAGTAACPACPCPRILQPSRAWWAGSAGQQRQLSRPSSGGSLLRSFCKCLCSSLSLLTPGWVP